MAELLVDPQRLPAWLRPLAAEVSQLDVELRNRRWVAQLKKLRAVRHAAVLVLIAGSSGGESGQPPEDATVLLTRRAPRMRSHAGQVAFPGGAVDPTDDGPLAAALREAWEETGVDIGGVLPFARLDPLFVPPSGFDVTPVLAFWERPSQVRPVNAGETDLVRAVRLDELLDPRNRLMGKRGPIFKGPAFELEDMFVWGFTGGLLSAVLAGAGWERPWDRRRAVEVEAILQRETDEPGTSEVVP
ncbi:MAG: NUDIX hydrolase [Segniliparus sp.]|uniref:NUDIX hydrolase n=1 Tax=Segniliparus sp. TaxID=2804064 RepID=UPI003F2AE194